MRRVAPFSIVSLLAFGLLLLATPDLAHAQASRTVSHTASLASDGEVVLDTYSGRVEVSTWDREEVRLEARIEDNNRELVERTNVLIEGDDARVVIGDEVERPGGNSSGGGFLSRLFGGDGNSGGDHPSVYYTLRVPRQARLMLDTYSSDVRVQDAGGDLVVDTYSGDADVQGLQGHLEADTYSGDVTARGLDGGAAVDTYSGDADLTFERLAGDVTFDSYSGDALLRLPRDAGFRLVADLGMSGDFESDFPSDAFSLRDDVYRGTVSGGGPRISFDTFSGGLQLRYAQP